MEKATRFRISLGDKELEVEGNEEFVKYYANKFSDVIENFANMKETFINADEPITVQKEKIKNSILPESFEEYYQNFPKDITDVDKVLVAGNFVQRHSAETNFKTIQANNCLKDIGIKVANASRAIGLLRKSKKVFTVSRGIYKMAKIGEDYLDDLLSGE